MRCQYSGMEIAAHIDPSLPVECPVCGAIRKIPGKHVWSDMFKYPSHKEPDGAVSRRRYKCINGVWKIVEA